jgi:DNA-binding NarL/FixJ family response regulator
MRVLLADDQSKVRAALRLLLEEGPRLSVIGEAAEAEDLLGQVEATHLDLVLSDWELPGLRTLCPRLKIIALSGRPEARQAALTAGADAFVSKGDPPERLLAAVNDCWHKRHRDDRRPSLMNSGLDFCAARVGA